MGNPRRKTRAERTLGLKFNAQLHFHKPRFFLPSPTPCLFPLYLLGFRRRVGGRPGGRVTTADREEQATGPRQAPEPTARISDKQWENHRGRHRAPSYREWRPAGRDVSPSALTTPRPQRDLQPPGERSGRFSAGRSPWHSGRGRRPGLWRPRGSVRPHCPGPAALTAPQGPSPAPAAAARPAPLWPAHSCRYCR